MLIQWPSSTQVTAVTAAASTDIFTKTAHGYTDTTAVYFLQGAGFTGITAGRRYFIRDAAANTFKLALTSGGSAIDITVDGTAGVFAAAVTIDSGERALDSIGERLDCLQISELIQPWLAASADPIARGNRRRTLPLSIPSSFTSERLAGLFFLERYDQLADSGNLLITVGITGDTSDRYAPAVLESFTPRWLHPLVVLVDYSFTAGPFTA